VDKPEQDTEPQTESQSVPVAWDQWHRHMPFGMVGAILWLGILTLLQYGVQQAIEREWIDLPAHWPEFAPHVALMLVFTAALVVYWMWRRKPLWSLGLSLRRLPGDLLFTLAGVVVVGLVYALVAAGVLGWFHLTSDAPMESFRDFVRMAAFNRPSWLVIIGVVVLYPILEEVWFRGVLYGPMRHELGRPVAIILTSLVFALAHGGIPINQFFGGLVFVIAYEYRRTLVAPILLHMIGNGALVLIGKLPWLA
jgi:membrane protease YdiL (CAAX protease family)